MRYNFFITSVVCALVSLCFTGQVLAQTTIDPASIPENCFYEIKENRAYYCGTIMPHEVDTATFEVISEGKITNNYAKDKNTVYIGDKPLSGSNPSSFRILTGSYAKDQYQVYYFGQIVKDANAESFEVFEQNNNIGRDNHAVYYRDKIVQEADPVRFAIIGRNYAYDASHVFYFSAEVTLLEDADPKTFALFDDMKNGFNWARYSHDSKHVYFYGQKIPLADPETFKIADNKNWANYASDGQALYCGAKRITGVDFNTFEYFGWHFDRDKNSVYIDCERVPNSDGATFIKLNETYYKDKNSVYAYSPFTLEAFQIKEADADTFQVMGGFSCFAKDKNFVYLCGKPFEVDDAESFRILDENSTPHYAVDKNAVYYFDLYHVVKIEGADPTTFTALNEKGIGLSKDMNHVFFLNKQIGDLNPNSFEVLKMNLGRSYYKDSKEVYFDTEKLEEASPLSFELIQDKNGDTYGKDTNSLYCGTQRLKNVDFESFEFLNAGYSRDKNLLYFKCKPVIGADPSRFTQLSPQSAYNHYYSDTNNIICNGESISKDVHHFEVFSDVPELGKDSYTVFRNCRPFLDADAQSFELIPHDYYCGKLAWSNNFYAWDKNYVYTDGKIFCEREDVLKTDLNYSYALNHKIYEGQSFTDIQKSPYKESIEKLYNLGAVVGYGNGFYIPDRLMSRAEFLKVMLSLQKNYDPSRFAHPLTSDVECFDDLGEMRLAAHICYAASKGFVHGYNDGFFRPNQPVKALEALAIIYQIEGEGGKQNPSGKEWYAPYYEDALEKGIWLEEFTGKSPVDLTVTRGQMAELIVRFSQKYEQNYGYFPLIIPM